MRKLFPVLLVMSIIMTAVAPAMAQEDSEWRVRRVSDSSYGPELGLSRPGVGTSENEVATMVGHSLRFQTADGEATLTGGCQQAVLLPDTYARNAGGQDFGFVVWELNPAVTEAMNEIAVLSWELAKQQVAMEDCEDLTDTELLDHVWVVSQDPNDCEDLTDTELLDHVWVVSQDPNNARLVVLTPWPEFRRPTGENHTLMVAPGDTVFSRHVGLGASDNNLCDNGNCLLVESPVWGWAGGGVVNYWEDEVPDTVRPILQARINRVVSSLDS